MTERRNPRASALSSFSTSEILELMNEEDARVAEAVRAALPQIAHAVDTIVTSVVKTGRAVVVQEGPMTAGFASEIVTSIAEEAFYSLEAPVARVTGPDTPYPFAAAVEEYYLPGEARLVGAVRRTLAA